MSVSNTQWSVAKTPADVTLMGVKVELDWTDSTINSIIVRDAHGNSLRVVKGEYSGMKAMVPAKVEKYRLHGTLCDSPFEQVFDEQREAERRQCELSDDLGEKAQLIIEKIKVPV